MLVAFLIGCGFYIALVIMNSLVGFIQGIADVIFTGSVADEQVENSGVIVTDIQNETVH